MATQCTPTILLPNGHTTGWFRQKARTIDAGKLVRVPELKVLVHPGFVGNDQSVERSEGEFAQKQSKRLFARYHEKATDMTTPKGKDALFIAFLYSESFDDFEGSSTHRRRVFRHLVKLEEMLGNRFLLLGGEFKIRITDNGTVWAMNALRVFAAERGFYFDSDTRLEVLGEMLDCCVPEAAFFLRERGTFNQDPVIDLSATDFDSFTPQALETWLRTLRTNPGGSKLELPDFPPDHRIAFKYERERFPEQYRTLNIE